MNDLRAKSDSRSFGLAQSNTPPNARPSFPFGIWFTLSAMVVISATLVSFMLPQYSYCTARVKIEQGHGERSGMAVSGVTKQNEPHFFQIEIEVIQSDPVLEKVIKQLGLMKVWGQKYGEWDLLSASEALRVLRNCTFVRRLPDTSLVEICCASEIVQEAADLANQVALSYQEYRSIEPGDRGLVKTDGAELAHEKTATLQAPIMVEIMEKATPESRRVLPNRPAILLEGILRGAIAGLCLASLVYAMRWRAMNRQANSSEIEIPHRLRVSSQVAIALVVGTLVGYGCAAQPSLRTIMVTTVSVVLGGVLLVWLEFIRLTPAITRGVAREPVLLRSGYGALASTHSGACSSDKLNHPRSAEYPRREKANSYQIR